MRSFLVLTCCLALAGVVRAEQDNDQGKGKGKGKKNQQTTHAATSTGNQAGNAAQGRKYQTLSNASQLNTSKKAKFKAGSELAKDSNLPAVQSNANVQPGNSSQFKKHSFSNQAGVQANTEVNAQNSSQWKNKNWSSQNDAATVANANAQAHSNAQFQANANKKWHAQNFKLQKNSGISGVQFRGNARIVGSDKWQGENYNAFRIYSAQRHNRDWWRRHHGRIVLVGGGYYYWDNGWWYPAWGYDPSYEVYAYDGPIFGYNDLPPDQVIANVQAALQREGYYTGEVDGMLGPLTRSALANYQRDHGLYVTAAIDRPTLQTLGMS